MAIDRFKSFRPRDDAKKAIERYREEFTALGESIADDCPVIIDARCLALALTKLEEAHMWLNKGIVIKNKELNQDG